VEWCRCADRVGGGANTHEGGFESFWAQIYPCRVGILAEGVLPYKTPEWTPAQRFKDLLGLRVRSRARDASAVTALTSE